MAVAGHESRKLARAPKQHQGWQLRIVKRRQRAFKITGLTWIVERSFAWLGRNRRLSKDYEYRVQTPRAGSARQAVDHRWGFSEYFTDPDDHLWESCGTRRWWKTRSFEQLSRYRSGLLISKIEFQSPTPILISYQL